MRLSDLLSQRRHLTVGEVSQIGIGVARSISALHCQNRTTGQIGIGDVEILSNQTAALRDSKAHPAIDPVILRKERSDALAESRRADDREDVKHLALLLIQIAKRGGLVGTKNYPTFHDYLMEVIRKPVLTGDFAIALYRNFTPEPIRWKDRRTFRIRSTRIRLKPQTIPVRNHRPMSYVIPSLLGLVALASWGFAIGLLLGR